MNKYSFKQNLGLGLAALIIAGGAVVLPSDAVTQAASPDMSSQGQMLLISSPSSYGFSPEITASVNPVKAINKALKKASNGKKHPKKGHKKHAKGKGPTKS